MATSHTCNAARTFGREIARPLLLKVNLGAGHGGASGRYDSLRDLSFDYAFLLKELGIAR